MTRVHRTFGFAVAAMTAAAVLVAQPSRSPAAAVLAGYGVIGGVIDDGAEGAVRSVLSGLCGPPPISTACYLGAKATRTDLVRVTGLATGWF